MAAIDVKEAKGDGEKGALGDGLVAEKVVENFSIAEQVCTCGKLAVMYRGTLTDNKSGLRSVFCLS